MKKIKWIFPLAFTAITMFFTSCDSNDNNSTDDDSTVINNGSVTEREADYLLAASEVLRNDCLTLWANWEGGTGEESLLEETEIEIGTPYADEFKNAGNAGSPYLSQSDAIDEMVQGIIGIADELGKVKMGSANGGEGDSAPEEAESRFSYNSLTDFYNNMLSIQNSYLGGFNSGNRGAGLTVFVASQDADLDAEVKATIETALTAIKACPEAFVNNLKDEKVETAMEKISDVEQIFSNSVSPLISSHTDYDFTEILADYVDNTIIPTYKTMFDNSQILLAKAEAFSEDMTDAKLAEVATAWKAARGPWENSESFLFGPAGDKNLDPLLDSWPVDETQLSNVLNSDQTLDATFVSEGLGYVTRGFHTVEYLIFRDGTVRELE
jgi:uncharacterized iron-regulated protein